MPVPYLEVEDTTFDIVFYQSFNLAHAQVLVGNDVEQLDLLLWLFDRKYGTSMSHAEFLLLQGNLNLSWKFQQTHKVGNRSSALTHTLCKLVLSALLLQL